jgi:uncharacterized protein YjbI with pentapeptide repeats
MKKLTYSLTFALAILAALIVHASSANPEHVAQFLSTKKCPGCDLRSARLGGIQAPNADLANADLAEAYLYGSNLRGANLTGAILERTNLDMVDLTGAVGAILATAITDERTTCPNGSPGPCN